MSIFFGCSHIVTWPEGPAFPYRTNNNRSFDIASPKVQTGSVPWLRPQGVVESAALSCVCSDNQMAKGKNMKEPQIRSSQKCYLFVSLV